MLLTCNIAFVILYKCQFYGAYIWGEMSEWLMELVLKTSDTARYRGFESLSLRQIDIFIKIFNFCMFSVIWRSTQVG